MLSVMLNWISVLVVHQTHWLLGSVRTSGSRFPCVCSPALGCCTSMLSVLRWSFVRWWACSGSNRLCLRFAVVFGPSEFVSEVGHLWWLQMVVVRRILSNATFWMLSTMVLTQVLIWSGRWLLWMTSDFRGVVDSFRCLVVRSCGEVTSLFEVVRVYLRLLHWFWDQPDFDCWSWPHLCWTDQMLVSEEGRWLVVSGCWLMPSAVYCWGCILYLTYRHWHWYHSLFVTIVWFLGSLMAQGSVLWRCRKNRKPRLDFSFRCLISSEVYLWCWGAVSRLLLRQILCRSTSLFFELASISVVTCYTFADSDMGCCQSFVSKASF